MGQDGFISQQSEDEWFVILKLTEIYRSGSALFLSTVSINSGFDLTLRVLKRERDREQHTHNPWAHKNDFIRVKLTAITIKN